MICGISGLGVMPACIVFVPSTRDFGRARLAGRELVTDFRPDGIIKLIIFRAKLTNALISMKYIVVTNLVFLE